MNADVTDLVLAFRSGKKGRVQWELHKLDIEIERQEDQDTERPDPEQTMTLRERASINKSEAT